MEQSKQKQCNRCTNDLVCYLPDQYDNGGKLIGWCDECNICQMDGCNNKYVFQICWNVGDFDLCRNACQKHSETQYTPGTDCECCSHAKNITKIPYVYCN
jgi:hypothetical protein